MATIRPFLWFDRNAEEARDFYLSVFNNARALDARTFTDWVSGTDRTVPVALFDFELEGLPFSALNAGPRAPFNERLSLYIETRDQAETDYFSRALSADGGSQNPCGWVKDKFGVYWQVVPEIALRLMSGPDRVKAARARRVMHGMSKIVIAELQAAYDGEV
ncbi:MAG: VOC family protein [Lysobacter sp.]